MVLDFGFLKDEMVRVIDAPCDHGLIVELNDRELVAMFTPPGEASDAWVAELAHDIQAQGFAQRTQARLGQKLYVVPFPPTAECLAKHWFERLSPAIAARSGGQAELVRVTVWETPNCRADFGLTSPAG